MSFNVCVETINILFSNFPALWKSGQISALLMSYLNLKNKNAINMVVSLINLLSCLNVLIKT